jgi:hypothetical protein
MLIAVVVAAAAPEEVAVAIPSIVDVPMSMLKAKYLNHLIVGFWKSSNSIFFISKAGNIDPIYLDRPLSQGGKILPYPLTR